MSDRQRAVLIACTGLAAWATLDDARLAVVILIGACAVAPWRGDS